MIVFQKRQCTKCERFYHAITSFFNFHPNGMYCLRNMCRDCEKKESLARYHKRKQKYKQKTKEYHTKNKDKIKKQHEVWLNNNKERVRATQKEYCKKNKKKINEQNRKRHQERMLEDELFRIKNNLRNSIKRKGTRKKCKKTEEILGCSFNEYKLFIEAQWREGMSWDNWGPMKLGYWQIHHKIPLETANTKEELLSLHHYTNHQPLWTEDHLNVHGKLL